MVCLFYQEKLFFKLAVGHPKNKKIHLGRKKNTVVHEKNPLKYMNFDESGIAFVILDITN